MCFWNGTNKTSQLSLEKKNNLPSSQHCKKYAPSNCDDTSHPQGHRNLPSFNALLWVKRETQPKCKQLAVARLLSAVTEALGFRTANGSGVGVQAKKIQVNVVFLLFAKRQTSCRDSWSAGLSTGESRSGRDLKTDVGR